MSKLLRGVTAQLLLLTVLPLTIILAVISFGSVSMHQQAMRQLVSDRDLRAVVATAGSLGASLQHKTDALQLVAESAAREVSLSPQPGTLTATFVLDADIVREFPAGIALYDHQGNLILSTASAADWATVRQAIGSSAPMTGSARSRVEVWNGVLMLHAEDRAQRIVAIGALPPGALQFDALVNPASDASHVDAFLFDSTGLALASTRADLLNADVHAHPGVAEALRGESGGVFRPDPGSGDEHIVSYAPVVTSHGPTGLGVVIEEPWQTVLDPLMRYSLAMPLITLPVLLLAALAVTFGVRRIVQPLQQLDQQAREIGQGHYDVLRQPVRGIDEVEQLQNTLRTMANQIQADQESLRGYAQAVTETQEAERKRLARELHDDTIQNLIVLSQRIQVMRQGAGPDQPQMVARLDDLRGRVLQMIEEIRRFSRALRPIYLEDAGLVAALERLCFEANATVQRNAAGMPETQVTFSTNGQPPRYKPDVELALYRMVQEALTNALRHAAPSRVAITLSVLPEGGLQLGVEDDGHGFAESATPGTGGFGLMGIRERALLIGAQVTIHSQPGKGTQVTLFYRDTA
jgi:two-component system sensor histidine kinase UhpB